MCHANSYIILGYFYISLSDLQALHHTNLDLMHFVIYTHIFDLFHIISIAVKFKMKKKLKVGNITEIEL